MKTRTKFSLLQTAKKNPIRSASAITILLFLAYFTTPGFIASNDARANVEAGVNLAENGSFSFAHSRLRLNRIPYFLAETNRRETPHNTPYYVSTFGPGTPMVAAPAYFLLRIMGYKITESSVLQWYTGKLVAGLLVAMSASFLYLTLLAFASPLQSVIIIGAYGLGTGVWSNASQTLYQLAPALLAYSIALYCYLGGKLNPKRWIGIGLALSFAMACRPTGAIALVVTLVTTMIWRRTEFRWLFLGALPGILFVSGFNTFYFGKPWHFAQQTAAETLGFGVWSTPFFTGFWGNLLSPSRGLFIGSPFLLAAFVGVWFSWREARWKNLRPLFPIVFLVWIPACLFHNWWGGWCYGNRLWVETIPFLICLMIPILKIVATQSTARITFSIAIILSVMVQMAGAHAADVTSWNVTPDGYEIQIGNEVRSVTATPDQVRAFIERNPTAAVRNINFNIDIPKYNSRIWSWSDNQYTYVWSHWKRERERRVVSADITCRQPPVLRGVWLP